MGKWSFGKKFFFFLLLLVIAGSVGRFLIPDFQSENSIIKKNEILHLEITGVILNGKKFLSRLKNNFENDNVKAILIEINSPGGAVGPSQELYYEIKRAKEKSKKPVICVSTSLIASGGYYAAMACDKLIVTPGAMLGSIGVIMQFANLEDLYGWAKIKKYSIQSGKFKDSGAEHRPMRDDERQLFQDMINEVFDQFKKTVAIGRNLEESFVAEYADGRVMTGAKAVELKFADQEGTFQDAVEVAAMSAGLKEDDYQLLRPRREHGPWYEEIFNQEDGDDDLNSSVRQWVDQAKNENVKIGSISAGVGEGVSAGIKNLLKLNLLNQPLYLMPGYWE